MIDLTMNRENLKRSIERAREKNIIIPTFAQMEDPTKIPEAIQDKLTHGRLLLVVSHQFSEEKLPQFDDVLTMEA